MPGRLLLLVLSVFLFGVLQTAQALKSDPFSSQTPQPNLFNRNHFNPSHKCDFCHSTHQAEGAALIKQRVFEDICRSCHAASDIARWAERTPSNGKSKGLGRFDITDDPKDKFSGGDGNFFIPPPYRIGGKPSSPGKGGGKGELPGKVKY